MAEPKPIASLSPRLLARKGGARPAMRSQASAVMISHDDLGWNDMGDDPDQTAQVVPIGPDTGFVPYVPEVVHQQRAIAQRFDGERRSALADGRRAAFTLRLDAERHLKLRLACTLRGRSAQQLVTEALDTLLALEPELATLAAHVAQKRH